MLNRAPMRETPLSVRRNFRDDFYSRTPILLERLSKAGLPNFNLTVDVDLVYASAFRVVDHGFDKKKLGTYVFEYFDAFVTEVEKLTDTGQEVELVESLRKIASKNLAVMVPDEEGLIGANTFCECQIDDDEIRLIFNPWRISEGAPLVISHSSVYLAQGVDAAIDALGEHELPSAIRRAVAKDINSRLQSVKFRLIRLGFRREFDLLPDLEKNYAFLVANPVQKIFDDPGSVAKIPECIASYFEGLSSTLESQNFGKDEGLREAFNEVTPKSIIRFELVEKLQSDKRSDFLFEDGEMKLQTTPQHFFDAGSGFHVARDILALLRPSLGEPLNSEVQIPPSPPSSPRPTPSCIPQ